MNSRVEAAYQPGPALSHDDFLTISSLIEQRLGISMPESKRYLIEARLRKRLAYHKLSFKRYIDLITGTEGKEELPLFINCITTHKTNFFREQAHFDLLQQEILPTLLKKPGNRSLSFWSAACSTGEEPYSIAMSVDDYRVKHPNQVFRYRVHGTDIAMGVLETAHAAIYPQSVIAPIPHSYRRRYLLSFKDPSRNIVRINPELRRNVSFGVVNLIHSQYPLPGYMDVIFCRNVLIYFNRKIQTMVIQHMANCLKNKGFLIIGHSESLQGMEVPFQSIHPTVYQKIGANLS